MLHSVDVKEFVRELPAGFSPVEVALASLPFESTATAPTVSNP